MSLKVFDSFLFPIEVPLPPPSYLFPLFFLLLLSLLYIHTRCLQCTWICNYGAVIQKTVDHKASLGGSFLVM